MRTTEQTGFIGASYGIGQFVLGGLFDHPVKLLQGAYGFIDTDRIADLNGAGQGFSGLDRMKFLESVLVAQVERIGALRLGANQPRQAVDQAQFVHHLEPLAEGADIAEIASRNNYKIRDLPIELMNQLKADGFLALNAKGIHGVRQINFIFRADFLYRLHASVKVGIQRQRQNPMSDGLYQLRE